MPVNTFSAAVHITPTVIKTFIEHFKRKGKKLQQGQLEEHSTDDICYDEAFHIVKSFIILGTKNTVESLQSFTNTHVPSPYWAAVSRVRIPLSCSNSAADTLINWFGPEELQLVVGGERWWQVRGLDGIDAEWITEREYLSPPKSHVKNTRKMSDNDKDILRMEHLETVMFYVHGGGYFWGSINTHRYQIIRYARKIKGRAFAVNYRKAPQYPWPCPLQDVLAAYLYLIDPPSEALHKAVPPSKIVFAGDSAGGGLSITVLTILRDMGLPLPAGAVLISPWVDLTHSFPSIMTNNQTDIIPPHGFLSRPSALWPVDSINDKGRVKPTSMNPPPQPGHADPLRPSGEWPSEAKESGKNRTETHTQEQEPARSPEMLTSGNSKGIPSAQENEIKVAKVPANSMTNHSSSVGGALALDDIDFWQPKPPKVLMNNPRDVPLEMHSQIHMYAATKQLSHPLVSPILQGSLGNLCPLYIIAGDDEVLRDEVIYLAHRAAHPDQFPAREGALRDGRRQRENAKRFQKPTKVHLQVYDGMCHVLTVFTFTNSAKYAYRSIAEFVRHVTQNPEAHLERNPFPELHRPSSDLSTDVEPDNDERHEARSNVNAMADNTQNFCERESSHTAGRQRPDVGLYKENEKGIDEEATETDQVEKMSGAPFATGEPEKDGKRLMDISNIVMIRERVDIHGKVRPMEPEEEVSALQIRPEEIGIIKEGPLNKWWSGQKEWDKRYRRNAEKAIKQRRRNEVKAKRMLDNAREQGLFLVHEKPPPSQPRRLGSNMLTPSIRTNGKIQTDRRWGPLDLKNENVPLSAIANRRDTPEALALLKKSIYHTAPVTHQMVPNPNVKISSVIRAAFDPNDDPNKHPRQSVSEQQVHRKHIFPGMHGLRLWDSIVSLFMREMSKKAEKGRKHAAASEKVKVKGLRPTSRLEDLSKNVTTVARSTMH